LRRGDKPLLHRTRQIVELDRFHSGEGIDNFVRAAGSSIPSLKSRTSVIILKMPSAKSPARGGRLGRFVGAEPGSVDGARRCAARGRATSGCALRRRGRASRLETWAGLPGFIKSDRVSAPLPAESRGYLVRRRLRSTPSRVGWGMWQTRSFQHNSGPGPGILARFGVCSDARACPDAAS
jgi:hypothetical protein